MIKKLNIRDRVFVLILIFLHLFCFLLLTLLCVAEYQTYCEYKNREEVDKVLIEHNLAIYTVDTFGNKKLELIKELTNNDRK